MKTFKTAISLYNYIGSAERVFVFYRSDSDFCSKLSKKFESYIDSYNASLNNIGIRFVYFLVDETNASDVEVIKVPQFRYFIKGNEVSSFIGDMELTELWNILGS